MKYFINYCFKGPWQDDYMDGIGTLCFAQDECYITGRFKYNDHMGVVRVEGEFKFNRYDSQVRLSRLHGYKWQVFFTLRLSNHIKTEREQILNNSLYNTLYGGEEIVSGEIKQDLFNIFQSRKHPLGKLLSDFILIFKEIYHNPEIHFMYINSAVDDVHSFMNLLSDTFISQFLKCEVGTEDCSQALHESLFPEISEHLMEMYNIANEEKNNKVDENIKRIFALSIDEQLRICGIDEKMWHRIKDFVADDFDWDPSGETAPFQTAVNAIGSLSGQHTVTKKLECIKIAANMVNFMLTKILGQFGADEFLPLFCLVVVRSETYKLQSECCYMDDFMDDSIRFSMYGYLLTQMQIASGFFYSCDISK